MEITNEMVKKIANLSKLEFSEEAQESIKTDLNKIIGFVSKLDELDTAGIEPLLYITQANNVLRDDVVANEVSKKDGLKNGPSVDSDYFRVPRVISAD